MPLVFTGIVPHPLQLAQTIKASEDLLTSTRTAFGTFETALYSSKPDILLLITSHGLVLSTSWQLILGDTLTGNLEEFSDFSTKIEVRGSVGFSHRLKERAEDSGFSVLLQSDRLLDYACVIPLLFLIKHLPSIKVAPLVVSSDIATAQYEFGKLIREEIFQTNERIAVIASANLSHRISRQSPRGYSRSGKIFDEKTRTALRQGDTEAILGLQPELVEEAVSCGIRPITLLLGTLYRRPYTALELSYEHPYGVGYSTTILQPS